MKVSIVYYYLTIIILVFSVPDFLESFFQFLPDVSQVLLVLLEKFTGFSRHFFAYVLRMSGKLEKNRNKINYSTTINLSRGCSHIFLNKIVL